MQKLKNIKKKLQKIQNQKQLEANLRKLGFRKKPDDKISSNMYVFVNKQLKVVVKVPYLCDGFKISWLKTKRACPTEYIKIDYQINKSHQDIQGEYLFIQPLLDMKKPKTIENWLEKNSRKFMGSDLWEGNIGKHRGKYVQHDW